MKLKTFLLICFSFVETVLVAKESNVHYIVQHYDEYNGLAQRWATQIVQGDDGYIWISTWNGLDRFDGYEFVNFKSTNREGHGLPSDRISDMWKLKSGDLLCHVDYCLFVFDTHRYKFVNVLERLERKRHTIYSISHVYPQKNGTIWAICQNGQRISMEERDPVGTVRLRKKHEFADQPSVPKHFASLLGHDMKEAEYCITDKGRNLWYRSNFGIYKAYKCIQQYTNLSIPKVSQIRGIFQDKKGRFWISGKEEKYLMLLDKNLRLIGYVNQDGRLSKSYSTFGASIYGIFQGKDNTLWLGSKPNGLYKLVELGNHFVVSNYKYEPVSDEINNNSVYDIKVDSYGRMWIATFSRGVYCFDPKTCKFHAFRGYPTNAMYLTRDLTITKNNVLLVATTGGLLVADIRNKDLRKVKFHAHVHDYHRESSLSNNATMSLFQSSKGDIYVTTESGGINRILSKNILADELEFEHIDTQHNFPTDVVLSMFEWRNELWAVCNNMLVKISSDGAYESFDAGFFKNVFRYSDAKPLHVGGGKWLFGLLTGAIILDLDHLHRSEFVPPLVVTGYAINDGKTIHLAKGCDTITLKPSERNVNIHFAALDFAAPERLEYAFMVNGGVWNYLQKNHSATFLNMAPGIYKIRIRSTNHDGVWVDNEREFTIVVEPTIWETTWAKIVYVFLGIFLIWGVVRTYRYIRSIKVKNKNLEAYLALINARSEQEEQVEVTAKEDKEMQILETAQVMASDDAFMKRVVSFVEAHLGDADINISDMAEAAATSRAGLNRKMKAILGITPKDFLREVRVQKACQLLKDKTLSINDVAYMCGFSDSRYFSRTFKVKVGMTPSEYRLSIS